MEEVATKLHDLRHDLLLFAAVDNGHFCAWGWVFLEHQICGQCWSQWWACAKGIVYTLVSATMISWFWMTFFLAILSLIFVFLPFSFGFFVVVMWCWEVVADRFIMCGLRRMKVDVYGVVMEGVYGEGECGWMKKTRRWSLCDFLV